MTSPYAENLMKALPKNYKIFTVKENPEWKNPLENLCKKIKTSQDNRAVNYSEKNFNIEGQEDIILIVSNKNKILAFSSLWKGPYFPEHSARALNRMWRDYTIRPYTHFKNLKLGQIMLYYQIKSALKENLKFIFLSREKPCFTFWRYWIQSINKLYKEWKIYPEMVKVCNGPYNIGKI